MGTRGVAGVCRGVRRGLGGLGGPRDLGGLGEALGGGPAVLSVTLGGRRVLESPGRVF